jgi:hypothetical protein
VAEAGKVTCQSIFSLGPKINRRDQAVRESNRGRCHPAVRARLEPRGEACRGRPCLARPGGSRAPAPGVERAGSDDGSGRPTSSEYQQWGLITKQQVEATGVAWTTLARRVEQGSLERIAHGVYRVRGGGEPDHLKLRAAWLQLEPRVPAWERTAAAGVVSHRSAGALYGIGHLPADTHEFTLPTRKQTRRKDVRLHRGDVNHDCVTLRGLPVTRPSRIAADLLSEREDLGAVARLIVDALRPAFERTVHICCASW